MNKAYLEKHSGEIEVDIFCCTEQEASGNEKSNKTEVEMDEMWSYYHDKKHQAWLWWAVEHKTNTPLAYVFGTREHKYLDELLRQYRIYRKNSGLKRKTPGK